MKPFALLSLVPIAGLVACASQMYIEPSQGQTARVRFSTDLDAPTMVWTYADEACTSDEQEWMRIRKGYLLNSSPRRLGMPLWEHHENSAKEFRVLAGSTRSYLFKGAIQTGSTVYSCGVAFRQAFQEGKDYEVAFSWHPTSCNIVVSEITDNQGTFTRKKIAVFDNQVTPANAQCSSQFKKTRLF
jgi:hypothetical protein